MTRAARLSMVAQGAILGAPPTAKPAVLLASSPCCEARPLIPALTEKDDVLLLLPARFKYVYILRIPSRNDTGISPHTNPKRHAGASPKPEYHRHARCEMKLLSILLLTSFLLLTASLVLTCLGPRFTSTLLISRLRSFLAQFHPPLLLKSAL